MRVLKGTGKIKRFVTFFNAFIESEDYSSEFTIDMTLRNPDDNFDRKNLYKTKDKNSESYEIDPSDKAFKIRTFTFDLNELSND